MSSGLRAWSRDAVDRLHRRPIFGFSAGTVFVLASIAAIATLRLGGRAFVWTNAAFAILLHVAVRQTASGFVDRLSKPWSLSRRTRVIALAGPTANLLCAAVAFAASRAPSVRVLAVSQAAWGAINLLPVEPFSCGDIVATVRPSRRVLFACLSASIAATLAIACVLGDAVGVSATFGFAAIVCVFSASRAAVEAVDEREGRNAELIRAERLLEQDRVDEATERAQVVLRACGSSSTRTRALKLLAWCAIARHDAPSAYLAVARIRPSSLDVDLVAACLVEADDVDAAIELLDQTRALRRLTLGEAKLLVDALVRRGDVTRATAIASEHAAELTPDETRRIAALTRADRIDRSGA